MMATRAVQRLGDAVVGGDRQLGLAHAVDLEQVGGEAGGDQHLGDDAGALGGEAAVGGGGADPVGVADDADCASCMSASATAAAAAWAWPPGVSSALAKSK